MERDEYFFVLVSFSCKMTERHSNTPTTGKHLVIAIVLNAIIFIVELVGGILTNSLALISDSLHNLSDFFALILSYIAS